VTSLETIDITNSDSLYSSMLLTSVVSLILGTSLISFINMIPPTSDIKYEWLDQGTCAYRRTLDIYVGVKFVYVIYVKASQLVYKFQF
jgi:hypothetical protein